MWGSGGAGTGLRNPPTFASDLGLRSQVVQQASEGLRRLLEVAMRRSLQDVDVSEMEELAIDSWCDLRSFVDVSTAAGNKELWELVSAQPTTWKPFRNGTKLACAPMTSLIKHKSDGATALHLAVAVSDNQVCVQLVCSRLQEADAATRNSAGQTALDSALANRHADAAVFLVQRFQG